jgi:NitT/TauT family transport system substrate-binding protein
VQFFADQGISEPSDLVGKTVGGTPGDAMYGTFPAWLELNGVDPADVTVVNVDAAGKIAALIEGRVDAIQGFFHDQSPTITGQTDKEMDNLRFGDFGMNLLGTGLLTHDDTIAEDPELVEAMMRALAKSFTEAQADPDAAAAAMFLLAEQSPASAILLAQMDLTFSLLGDGTPGVNTEKQWTETIEAIKENTDFAGEVDVPLYWASEFGAE